MPIRLNLDVSCLGNTQLTGIGNYAKNLIQELGHFPEISLSGSYKISRWKKADTIAKNVPFRTFPYWPVISDIRLQDFEIYHGLDFFVPSSKKFKKIVTVHDLAVYKTGLWNTKEAKTSSDGFEKVLFQHKPDHVVTVSESIKTEFLEKFPSFEGRVTAIHHGADHFVVPIPSQAEFSFPYIFCLGTVEIRKNTLGLVNSFEKIASENKEIHLVIAGQPGYKSEDVRSKIEKSPFKSRIHWHEKASNQQITNWMQHCTVFCYPSFYEGFGIPLVEAMSLEAPIVTSNTGAMKEISGDAAVHFDPHGSAEELATALNTVINDPLLQSELRAKGNLRKNDFTWKNAAAQTVNVYKEVLHL